MLRATKLVESERQRVQILRSGFPRMGCLRVGIDAGGQDHPNRHISHKMMSYGIQ